MEIFKTFGHYSGLVINWTKSSLMLLDRKLTPQMGTLLDILVSTEFWYLGIQVTPNSLEYITLNLTLLLGRCHDQVKVWSRLKLVPVGRINLIKMILMPQILYVLHNSPIVVPLKQFRFINSCFRSLTWHNASARVSLEQLQHPNQRGGMALSNPWLYDLASQLQHIARAISSGSSPELNLVDSTTQLLSFTIGGNC